MISDNLTILTDWAARMSAIEVAGNSLRDSVGVQPEAPLMAAIIDLQMLATRAVADVVGDHDEWLEWYWLETNMGRKTCHASAPRWKTTRKINTPKRLLQIIEATR